MRPNIIDFTTRGQAVIDMPNYDKISFLENFGFSPIKNVEQEAAHADIPERAAFLQRYIKAYKETFSSPPKTYLKEAEDDEGTDFEAMDEHSVYFRNIRLLHTSAWYIVGHVSAEIQAVKRHLEELDGLLVAAKNLGEVIKIIKQSRNPNDACSNLQKRFEISAVKAKYILNLPLTKLSSSTISNISIEREDYELRLKFLCKLEPQTRLSDYGDLEYRSNDSGLGSTSFASVQISG